MVKRQIKQNDAVGKSQPSILNLKDSVFFLVSSGIHQDLFQIQSMTKTRGSSCVHHWTAAPSQLPSSAYNGWSFHATISDRQRSQLTFLVFLIQHRMWIYIKHLPAASFPFVLLTQCFKFDLILSSGTWGAQTSWQHAVRILSSSY